MGFLEVLKIEFKAGISVVASPRSFLMALRWDRNDREGPSYGPATVQYGQLGGQF